MKRLLALMIAAICCFGMTANADTDLEEMIQRSRTALQPYIELLGGDLGDGVVQTSQEFIDNLSSIELMGKIGTVSHGFSEGLSIIDTMDWISNDEASEEEFRAFVQMLNSFFHYESTCHDYEGYSTETYQWVDFEDNCMVFGWLSDDRINVRWYQNEEWVASMETAALEPSLMPMPEGGASGDAEEDDRPTDDELIVSPEFSMFGVRFGDNISAVEQQMLEVRRGTFQKMGKDEEYEALKDYGTVWFTPEASYKIFGAEVNSVIFSCDEDMLEIYNVSKIAIRYEKGAQKFEQVKAAISDKLGEPEFVDADKERYYKWQAESALVTLGGVSFSDDLREIESGAEQFELEFSPYEEASEEDADSGDILPMPRQKLDGVFSMRNDIRFGDSMEEVRAKERVALAEETSEEGEVYLNAKGIEISTIQNSEISYYFDERGGLKKTIMRLNGGDISQTQLDDDYAIIHSGLIRKYGEPAHSMDGDDEFIRNDELTGHGLYSILLATDLLAKLEGRSSNSQYTYDQWYFQDDEGIILIEQFSGFLAGSDTLAMHYVNYYRFADDLSRAQEEEVQAAQAAVEADL